MFRLKIALVIFGAVLAFMGFQERSLSQLAKPEPASVELSSLEGNPSADNAHLLLGEHVAVYSGLIYEYKQSKYGSSEPTADTKVTFAYYPIISYQHPFIVALDALNAKYPQGIPDDVPAPDFKDFTVLVKTGRFATVGDLPDGLSAEDSLQGLVVNEIEHLGSDEIELLQQSFPRADLSRVLILQEGRKPAGAGFYFGMMGGGTALSLLGIGLFFVGRRKS